MGEWVFVITYEMGTLTPSIEETRVEKLMMELGSENERPVVVEADEEGVLATVAAAVPDASVMLTMVTTAVVLVATVGAVTVGAVTAAALDS
jgi:endo-alpha-1,4-polygalactosaminidase (GH114 family)